MEDKGGVRDLVLLVPVGSRQGRVCWGPSGSSFLLGLRGGDSNLGTTTNWVYRVLTVIDKTKGPPMVSADPTHGYFDPSL